jgi:hypothetical protein
MSALLLLLQLSPQLLQCSYCTHQALQMLVVTPNRFSLSLGASILSLRNDASNLSSPCCVCSREILRRTERRCCSELLVDVCLVTRPLSFLKQYDLHFSVSSFLYCDVLSMSRRNSRRTEKIKTAQPSRIWRCPECQIEFQENPPFASSSWLRIVYEAFRRLHDEGRPHRKYFHYKHDICNYIDKHWYSLCPEKKRTLTWNNTVSAVITTHRKLFKSSRRQSGYWTLRSFSSPDSTNCLRKRESKRKRTRTRSSMEQRHSVLNDFITSKTNDYNEEGDGEDDYDSEECSTSTTNVTRVTDHNSSPSYSSVPITWRRRRRPASFGATMRRTRRSSTALEFFSSSYNHHSNNDSPTTPIQIPIPTGWVEKCALHPLLTVNTANVVIPVPKWKLLKQPSPDTEINDHRTVSRRSKSSPKRSKKSALNSPLNNNQNNFHNNHANNIHTNHHRAKRMKLRHIGTEIDGENDDDKEDTSDERYINLHAPLEQLEKQIHKYGQG